jgi:PiT family inorganic phosphate transporter
MIFILLILAAAFVAFSNGANDNFKGVASIYGSGTASYRAAMLWGTMTTFAGSIVSVFLAPALLKKFSGQGLVPDAFIGSEYFLLAVALGAGATIILATRSGFPISTTHAILGSLVGTGAAAAGFRAVDLGALGRVFVAPLLFSPIVAVLLGGVFYLLFHSARRLLRIPKEWCLCVGTEERVVAIPTGASMLATKAMPMPALAVAAGETVESCSERYAGTIAGIDAQRAVDVAHFLSAGVVSFARGLNDTPKIAALLLLVKFLTPVTDVVIVAVTMAVGALLCGRRVAETMGHKITRMNPGQAFTSNFATGILVIVASTVGLPVSTTHVAVGSLFGIGLTTGQGNPKVALSIVLSWLITLPCAALLGAVAFTILPHG